MPKGFHFLARHDDRVGEHLVGRAGARADLAPHRTVEGRTRRKAKYRVEKCRHCRPL